MHDFFGQFHLVGEFGVVWRHSPSSVRGLSEVKSVLLLHPELCHCSFGQNDAGRGADGGYLEREH